MVASIPRRLLIHEIEYEAYAGNNGWDDSWEPAVTIKNVRVSPSSKVQRTSNSEGENVKHVVYVDRMHSTPFPNFKKKSKVTWDGDTYELTAPNPYYDFKSDPHHYELELS